MTMWPCGDPHVKKRSGREWPSRLSWRFRAPCSWPTPCTRSSASAAIGSTASTSSGSPTRSRCFRLRCACGAPSSCAGGVSRGRSSAWECLVGTRQHLLLDLPGRQESRADPLGRGCALSRHLPACLRSRSSSWLAVGSRDVGLGLSLDGLIAALGVAAVSAAVVVEAVLRAMAHASTAVVATSLAYPLCDLVLLGLVIGAFALSGWRFDRMWVLLGGGLVVFTVTDGIFLFKLSHGTYVSARSSTPAGCWAPCSSRSRHGRLSARG